MIEKKHKELPFEEAYRRLEEILEKLNGGETPLEESLQLYEEADRLIASCNTKLSSAEQKIQMLIKNRDGTLQKEGADGVAMHDFQGAGDQMMIRNPQEG